MQNEFDSLIGPLVEPAYRLAMTMLRSSADAEDAVQEATTKAWRNLHRLNDPGAVRSWYLTIVANQCRSMLRGRWWSVLKVADPERRHSGLEEGAVERADLRAALLRLAPDDRLALHLRYELDMELAEVAAVLGTSETAAKSRVHRALERLRPAVQAAEAGW